jgi:hypothetical protein
LAVSCGWGDAGLKTGTAGQQSGALALSHHASPYYYRFLFNSTLWVVSNPTPYFSFLILKYDVDLHFQFLV